MATEKQIDDALNAVLESAGSHLTYFMPPARDKMRNEMRRIMTESYIAGSNDNFNAMKQRGKK